MAVTMNLTRLNLKWPDSTASSLKSKRKKRLRKRRKKRLR
jgi:hypothetical protein